MAFDSQTDFSRALAGDRLTTIDVLYYMPDHPTLLQSFLWQTYDAAPDYPRLMRFLGFWRTEIEAVIHSVRVAHAGLIAPATWRHAELELRLN